MTGLTVDTAKNIAIGVIIVFLVLSVVSAWLIKNIVTKLVMVALMAGLALGAWTQRSSLQDCADRAKQAVEQTTNGQTPKKVTCTFFGTEVDLPAI